ncbi:MAG: hypothetical protein JSW00_06370 [Thermoplasmata archaeon]|nr:MAG: hypothetical protein JSW00_06370 [Thermoplasmata archaeon]
MINNFKRKATDSAYQEIEDTLYVSFHTVKNHIYRLYQKMCEKSRGQLVHLILKSINRNKLKKNNT